MAAAPVFPVLGRGVFVTKSQDSNRKMLTSLVPSALPVPASSHPPRIPSPVRTLMEGKGIYFQDLLNAVCRLVREGTT